MANKVSFIIQMKDKFSGTAKKFNRQFKSIEKSAEKAELRLKAIEMRTKSLRKTAGKLAKVGGVMTAAVTAPLLLMSKSMIKAASDAEETANKFNAVFKDIAPAANKAADDFAKKFTLAGSTARKMIGDTGDLLVGFKFASKQALDLSTSVTKLALDLDSFQNFEGGVEGASKAITKALLGETESMKSLGVSVQQNTKEFRNQVKVTSRVEGVTLRQAKALVILRQIQDQTLAATDDYTNTLNNSYAGAVRKSTQANIQMKESFGKLLLPIATKAVGVFTSLAEKINGLSPVMKGVILGIGAFLAIGGPLLVLLGGIAAAVTFISLPVLLITLAIVAVGVALTALALNWDVIMAGMKSALIDFVNIAIRNVNLLLKPLSFVSEKLGMGKIEISKISKTIVAPVTPAANDSTLNGTITVAAEPGAVVKETSMNRRGSGARLGLNLVTG